MGDITDILGGPFVPASTKYVDPPELQLADAMRSAGIEPPAKLILDGNLHRFSTKGRSRDDSGWYVVFADEPVAGRFGCWRDQIESSFRAEIGRELSAAENMVIVRRQAEAKARRDVERAKKAEISADTVQMIWSEAISASPDHPYLTAKGIQPNGSRLTGDGRLIVPLFDADGALSSLQYISNDEKRYHPGGSTKGCCWLLGEISENEPIFVAEGFATAATIHEVSGKPCFVAYSANNLPIVVGQIRETYGRNADIVVVADNDASGIGLNLANQAAAKHGARVVVPPELGDANDFLASGGDLGSLIYPAPNLERDWLVGADDFSAQPAPISWLIKRYLQTSALIMVHGPPAGGKTFLVLDMALSVASMGSVETWFGEKVRHGPVVYLAGEGHHGLRGRIAAWKQDRGVDRLEMWLSRHGLDLNTPSGYQKTADAIRALPKPPKIIVVDTLHRFLDGDENSAVDTKTMLDACSGLMEQFGASVILVHHTGVSSEAQHRARGSSAWRGALDIEISVIPGDAIEVVMRKSKDAEPPEPVWAELKSVPIAGWLDEDGEQVTSAVLGPAEQPAKNKKDPVAKHMDLFGKAWWSAGAPDRAGAPYLTKEQLEIKLEADGLAERTIKNYLNTSEKTKLIGALIEAKAIIAEGDGWSVVDPAWASQLMISRGKS